jgi:2,4-dienoyl-CoA reductase-like NADH-dependent reductase (Old Yellow Enzyme family)
VWEDVGVAAAAFDHLLSPIDVGPLHLRNRVVATAHGSFLDFYRPGEPPDRYVAYQERRARGGVGLIILQPIHVHPSSRGVGHYIYEPDDLRRKLEVMARTLHALDTPVLAQLLHFGAEFRSDVDLTPLWSFSGTVSPTGAEAAHEMTPAEIEEVIDGFARTAEIVVEAGIDGVELSASHGYLLQQSFSPWANRRTDEWGEPFRFITTVIERIRERIGAGAVLGARISVDDWVSPAAGGLGPAGMQKVGSTLAATGQIDYLNLSAGARAAHYHRSIGSYEHEHGELLPLDHQMRAHLRGAVPVIGVGRITTPELAEQALRRGDCDLVAMTRATIADPDVVAKVRHGHADRIRPCVGANQGCVDRMVGGMAITCFHNPAVGREYLLDESPAAESRRVLVIGGGPAGLAAAAAAARRGHRVVLHERNSELGGRFRLVGRCGRAAELLGAVHWLIAELDRLGVEVHVGSALAAEGLAAGAADTVILATGAAPQVAGLPAGAGSVPIVTTDAMIEGARSGQRVLIVDQRGVEELAHVAEAVALAGAEVTVATPMATIGAHVGFTRIREHLLRLHAVGCTLLTSTQLLDIRNGYVELRRVHARTPFELFPDVVVAGVPGRPNLDLRPLAEATGARVLVAGDATAPRSAMHAFREGDAAGRAA